MDDQELDRLQTKIGQLEAEIELLRKLIQSTRLPACGCGRREMTARYLKELER